MLPVLKCVCGVTESPQAPQLVSTAFQMRHSEAVEALSCSRASSHERTLVCGLLLCAACCKRGRTDERKGISQSHRILAFGCHVPMKPKR
jgi:hypothetical protein